jgi:hypothetical protein
MSRENVGPWEITFGPWHLRRMGRAAAACDPGGDLGGGRGRQGGLCVFWK